MHDARMSGEQWVVVALDYNLLGMLADRRHYPQAQQWTSETTTALFYARLGWKPCQSVRQRFFCCFFAGTYTGTRSVDSTRKAGHNLTVGPVL